MPTYRSITTSLTSQYDALTIPEYEPPTVSKDPFLTAPTLVNHDHSLVCVYVPVYAGSQFWLSYSISPPYPPEILYYFKLYINGTHVVSWGCGKENGYEGKTVFGLFDPGPDPFKSSPIERRAFHFGPTHRYGSSSTLDSPNQILEIKVFRSNGRKRTTPELQGFSNVFGKPESDRNKSQLQLSGNGINLVNAGLLPPNQPRRFYNYVLVDPLNQPFATFRYYYRNWDQLEALGVVTLSPRASRYSISTSTESTESRRSSRHNMDPSIPNTADFSTKLSNAITDAISTSVQDDGVSTAKAIEYHPVRSTTRTEGTVDSPDDDTSSPLRITTIKAPSIARPPTPPRSKTPSRLSQLPQTIPQTESGLNTLASKKSFTSLIRTRVPDPDTSAFHLHEMVAEPKPTNQIQGRGSSLSALKNVVASAKSRRKKTGEEFEIMEDRTLGPEKDRQRYHQSIDKIPEDNSGRNFSSFRTEREKPEGVKQDSGKDSEGINLPGIAPVDKKMAEEGKHNNSKKAGKSNDTIAEVDAERLGRRRHRLLAKEDEKLEKAREEQRMKVGKFGRSGSEEHDLIEQVNEKGKRKEEKREEEKTKDSPEHKSLVSRLEKLRLVKKESRKTTEDGGSGESGQSAETRRKGHRKLNLWEEI